MEKYNTYDSEVADRTIDFIKQRAKTDQPFFVNFWGKGNHFWSAHPDFRDTPAGTNTSAQMVEHDYNTGRILKTLKDLGIAENTLVIWSSDNGPMYTMHPYGGYSLLPDGKGETREGGIRVPALAWWPGMNQEYMLLIQKYPHRKLEKSYYRDFDRSFDPEPTPVYKAQKQVEW